MGSTRSRARGTEVFALNGRRALVTGGARGIGLAIAARLYECGAAVTVVDRRFDHELDFPCDHVEAMLVPEGVADVVAAAQGTGAPFDLLINNAAVIRSCPLSELDAAFIDDVAGTNFNVPILLCREIAERLDGGAGSIINVASSGGLRVTNAGGLVYGSLKAALSMATAYLAKELGPNVRVNAIAPGSIASGHDIADSGARERVLAHRQHIIERSALGRLGDPDEIAAVAVFLASDGASYIDGQTILVDGGWLLD